MHEFQISPSKYYKNQILGNCVKPLSGSIRFHCEWRFYNADFTDYNVISMDVHQ